MVRPRSRYDLSKLDVFVVDPSKYMLSLFGGVFRAFGITNLDLIQDSDEAFKAISKSPLGIALVDWDIAPVNGIDFVLKLRKDQSSPNPFLSLILTTAHAEAWRVGKAINAGINGFLAKPISVKSLCTQIVAVIEDDRPFVRFETYFGPDRRTKIHDVLPNAVERRRGEVEFIYPPDGKLRSRVISGDQTAPAIDPRLIERAEKIVEEMGKGFSDCLGASLSEMQPVFDQTDKGSWDQRRDRICELAQELRSIAGTFGYPLVTEFCGSLVVYLQSASSNEHRADHIVKMHLDALGVIHRDDVKGDGGDTGRDLVIALGELTRGSASN